jgi:hypothetical protein
MDKADTALVSEVKALLREVDDVLAEAAGLLSYDSPGGEESVKEMRGRIAEFWRSAPMIAEPLRGAPLVVAEPIGDYVARPGGMVPIDDVQDAVAAERDACKQIARQHEEASRELGFDGAANAAASIAETITYADKR